MSIRLNPNLLPDLLISIQQAQQNQATTTVQLASGRSVNQLSDDPEAVAALVANHNQANQDDQFLRNAGTLQSNFQVADSTLGSVVTVLTRAVSIGTEGANGTLSSADRQAIAGEVQGLLTQLVSLGNATFQGKYIFAGTAVNNPPFTLDTTTNNVTYNGNTGVSAVQLSSGNAVNVNVPGSQILQNASGNAFAALQNLAASLISGNNIGTAVTQVSTALSQVSTQRVTYGNLLNQVSLSDSYLSQDKVNLSIQENGLVAVDPAKAATNLAQAQVADQSVLAATARVLNLPNLLSFLK